MPATVELLSFTAPQNGDESASRALEVALNKIASNVGGKPRRVFHGIQVENNRVGYLAFVWDSEEEAAEWEERAAFEAKAKSIIGEPVSKVKIRVDSTVPGAFEAPVTDFGFIKLKDGASREEFKATMGGIIEKRCTREKGSYAPNFGPVKEGASADMAVIIGWDSIEAHFNAFKGELKLQRLAQLANVTVVHAPFKRLSKL